jgi:hypothetical protein
MLGAMSRTWWLAGVLTVLLAGSSIWPRTLLTTFPAKHDDLNIAPLPVILRDWTGLAMGIQIATGFAETGPVNVIPGDPNALVVSWTGGACSDRARLALSEIEGRYQLRIDEDLSLWGDDRLPGRRDPSVDQDPVRSAHYA